MDVFRSIILLVVLALIAGCSLDVSITHGAREILTKAKPLGIISGSQQLGVSSSGYFIQHSLGTSFSGSNQKTELGYHVKGSVQDILNQ